MNTHTCPQFNRSSAHQQRTRSHRPMHGRHRPIIQSGSSHRLLLLLLRHPLQEILFSGCSGLSSLVTSVGIVKKSTMSSQQGIAKAMRAALGSHLRETGAALRQVGGEEVRAVAD
jgi:hypothetical protein